MTSEQKLESKHASHDDTLSADNLRDVFRTRYWHTLGHVRALPTARIADVRQQTAYHSARRDGNYGRPAEHRRGIEVGGHRLGGIGR